MIKANFMAIAGRLCPVWSVLLTHIQIIAPSKDEDVFVNRKKALLPSQQQGTYYTQPLYAPPPHVIHHTTVVQPNGMPATMYAPPIPQPRPNGGIAMGMVAGTTMAMSAGTLLTTHSPAGVPTHQLTYRPPGTPTYSYVPPQCLKNPLDLPLSCDYLPVTSTSTPPPLGDGANTVNNYLRKGLLNHRHRAQRSYRDFLVRLTYDLTGATKHDHILMELRPIEVPHDLSLGLTNAKMARQRGLMGQTRVQDYPVLNINSGKTPNFGLRPGDHTDWKHFGVLFLQSPGLFHFTRRG
ncbi:Myelin-associated neurite-outgrowth inhibitor [Merluccius polli]|uniref:Myelin-associated neurite-outgrowth inhibitor n=1 Tax=Merluccius polli TaxID=89951 RepID=A0AA47NZF6_MERPO|nr:Myelin-associated neurite-outgrowth inhibitor [Merluccius polli]